jgi:adenosylcobinamide-phosphate synthase
MRWTGVTKIRARRALLQEWRHLDASELPRTEVLRHVIEHALLAAHRHVFWVSSSGSSLLLGPGTRACDGRRVVPHGGVQFSRYWGYKSAGVLDAPANQRLLLAAVAAGLFAVARSCAGATDRLRFRRGRQLRGGRRRAGVSDAGLWQQAERRCHPGRSSRCRGRRNWAAQAAPEMSRPIAVQDASNAVPSEDGSAQAAEGSTAGAPAQVGHLHSGGGPSVALGRVVDAAGGSAHAGQRPRL